jgi:hypothetical protein
MARKKTSRIHWRDQGGGPMAIYATSPMWAGGVKASSQRARAYLRQIPTWPRSYPPSGPANLR